MCGIAGILSLEGAPVSIDEARAMCTAMTHRGPDDEGYFSAPGVCLGMRRLSIIDLHSGHQPICNEDGTVHAVFNGEIYNYLELRRDLEARGHVFRTRSDTETLVHLYEERGEGCVDELRGMFAFAIWDATRRRLLVARDRLGIKPLYYAEGGGRLLFASELKALIALPEVERRVNVASLDHLLTTLTTPAAESILEGVHKLEPAHLLIAAPGSGVRVKRYWQVELQPGPGRAPAEWEDELRARVDESVGLHMLSDVPVGAFLSGGVDSTSVVAAMIRKSARPVKTFSIGFPEKEFSELAEARKAAAALGTEHRELVVEPASMSVIEDIAWHLDEPFGDSSAIPTYLVSQLAAQEVKVVLSGDGGDELFGGYDRYVVEGRERRRTLPGFLRAALGAASSLLPPGARGKRWLRHQSLPPDARYLDACSLFSDADKSSMLKPAFARALAERRAADAPPPRGPPRAPMHWLSSLRKLDLEGYLPLDILTKVDRMSMAWSIEARVPLLDHKLVEFAATLPPELLIRGRETKVLFKRAMRGRLPREILERRKRGFAIPLGLWFRGDLGDYARDLLLSARCRQRGFFEASAVEKLASRAAASRDELGLQLWTLLSLELWCRAFLDRVPRSARAPRERAVAPTAPEARKPWLALAR